MVTIKAVFLRSVVVPAAILLAIAATALTITYTTPGVRLWTDLVSGLTASSVFTGLIAAGAAAVESNRWRHSHRVRHASARRPRWSIRAVHACAVIVPLTLGFWVAVGALSVYAVLTHSYGTPSFVWLLSLFCALVLAGSVGYFVGAALPYRWYVGPAAALVFYAAYVILIIFRIPYGLLSLYPASSNLDSAFVRPVVKTFVGQSVFFLAASFILICFLAIGSHFSRRAAAVLLTGVVIAIVGGGTVISTNGLATTGHNPAVYSCSGQDPTMCLNPGYVLASKALGQEFKAMNERAAGTDLVATRLEQNLEGNEDAPTPGSRIVYLEQWSTRRDLTFAVSRYVEMYGGLSHCSTAESGDIENEVNVWLSDHNTSYGDPDPVVTKFNHLSVKAGNAWFRDHYDAYATCTLKMSDLP